MAKKKLLADKLRTPRTRTKKPLDLSAAESVDKKEIPPKDGGEEESHKTPDTKPAIRKSVPKKEVRKPILLKEKTHRTSFNFPESVYEALRTHSFQSRTSMTDYIVGLIKKDLKIK
jgi:hypothetical protein